MKLEDCTRAVELAREVNLGINLFFVIGFPEETWEEVEATISLCSPPKETRGPGGLDISCFSFSRNEAV